ncbi:MAG: hypothetical protein JJT88_08345 [Gammaproteobacteria bacterium]|nr:hypothetical protein [Gammaproteobacteria bacterium]
MEQTTATRSLATPALTALPLLLALLLANGVAAQTPEQPTADAPTADLPNPEAWDAGPDRETLVRFARAWGLVSGMLQSDAPDVDPLDDSVAAPEELSSDVSRKVRRHIRNNGLDQEQWANLIARMDADPDFRTRVEMLAIPYQTPTD